VSRPQLREPHKGVEPSNEPAVRRPSSKRVMGKPARTHEERGPHAQVVDERNSIEEAGIRTAPGRDAGRRFRGRLRRHRGVHDDRGRAAAAGDHCGPADHRQQRRWCDPRRASAKLVAHDAVGPTVDALVPAKAVAGEPVTLSATARPTFGTGPFTYKWMLPGETLTGASVTAPIRLAGTIDVRLDVSDSAGHTTTRVFPVLVAQHTQVGIGVWNGCETYDPGFCVRRPLTYGSSPQVWADIRPVRAEGTQCNWNQNTGDLGCVNPTGVVQFLIDGNPIGDPMPVTTSYTPPCVDAYGTCKLEDIGLRVYAPAPVLPALTVPPGSHPVLTAVYYGDDKYVGNTASTSLDVAKATPDVALTSGVKFPSPTQPARFTVSVLPKSGATGLPTGTVRILDGTSLTPLSTAVPIDSTGIATVTLDNLVMRNSVVVQYNGDENFALAESAKYNLKFNVPTTATVTPASTTVRAGAAVDLTITILDADGDPVPGASVALSPGGATGTTGDDGTVIVTVTSAAPGDVTYTVAANGVGELGTVTVTYGTEPSLSAAAVTGEVGVPLSTPLAVSGAPYPTVTVDGLPTGLSFDPATRTITGVPDAPGETVATATATSALGTASTDIDVTVVPALAIETSSLPNATAGLEYGADVAVTGGLGPFVFSARRLPAGLSVDAGTGHISGTPAVARSSTVHLAAVDSLGGEAMTSLKLTVLPQCGGQSATIVGTAGDDVLAGTTGADVIVALAGHDRIRGRGGNDVICAGVGNDTVVVGDGDDSVSGGAGRDVLWGREGDDSIAGGDGLDWIAGGSGQDRLLGQAGNDVVSGGLDDDELLGGAGRDRLFGGADDDRLLGGAGDDLLAGGPGVDVIAGGPGHDRTPTTTAGRRP
jgi:Ca2+-binding RTX toxin-like protein